MFLIEVKMKKVLLSFIFSFGSLSIVVSQSSLSIKNVFLTLSNLLHILAILDRSS